MSASSSLNESLWNYSRNYGTPVVIIIYILILIVAVVWNLFLIILMLGKKLILKDSTSVFLFCLAIVDLTKVITTLPFHIKTLIAGEWIFGDDDDTRQSVCNFSAFSITFSISMSIHILMLISFDRCLTFVYALKYDRVMTPLNAWLLAIATIIPSLIISTTPFYGLGRFFFSESFGGCVFDWGYGFSGLYVGELLIVFVIMIVLSIITFIYIQHFLHKMQRRASQWSQNSSIITDEHRLKQRAVTKIFLFLFLVQIVCFGPGILIAISGFFVGFENIPSMVYLVGFVIILLNPAINPILQSVFKKEVRETLSSMWKYFKHPCSFKSNPQNVHSSTVLTLNISNLDFSDSPALSAGMKQVSFVEMDERIIDNNSPPANCKDNID